MGGGGGTTTTTSQVNMGPWSTQQPYLGALFGEAQQLSQNNGLNVPINDTQNQSLQQLSQLGLQPSAQIGQANDLLTKQLNGSYLSPTSNPYLAGMFNTAADAVTRQYQTGTSPETQSMFAAANRTGSGGEQNAITQNQLNYGQTLNNLANQFYGGAYNQGVQNQLAAAGLSPALDQASFINPITALNAGNELQQLQLQQQLQPWQSAQLYQGLVTGNYGQSGTTTSQVPYYSNPLGQGIGGALSLAGTVGSLFTPGAGGISAIGNIFGSGPIR